ncbi:Zinc finger CCCH domain-containing protein [Cercospora beticola]|uniref:Zinc finger CCCH domain-containing protein n=1 Tax=Cercospora beticola TaxID=122368 RepID=A0A2G5IB16_CERBT|nr:Zinc finger CCCH domain-containing protein [Cercospora beticola]PIB01882.1 Zinc finger CCCH domain-containing protein [Cercospora beticola]WPA96628.1 hypothetical protein RHO25_001235 [Cercospora beticola]CAK1355028.1 unnamed protein product [Cercospora beticola]
MSEDEVLQARIAALAGQINKHRQQPPRQGLTQHSSSTHDAAHFVRGAHRWSPYSPGARPLIPHPVKNRTLVLGGGSNNLSSTRVNDVTPRPIEPSVAASGRFVTSRMGNRSQLMTKETYEREQRQRQEYKDKRAGNTAFFAPQQTRNAQQDIPSTPATRVLEFDGIQFELQPHGDKLVRLADPATADGQTPRKVTIADVDFLRTKNGNLIRAMPATQDNTRPPAPASRKQCEKFTRHGTISTHLRPTGYLLGTTRSSYLVRHGGNPLLHTNMVTGNCPFGPSCRNRHDPTRIAICKEFFTKGSCTAGKNCDLSHEPTYHRVPACTYFLRGNCTNSACRYAHVTVSTSTLVCRPFATLGYCSKGVDCGKRHVFECPDYTNHGRCEAREKGLCSLPHIDRASSLRKAAKRRGDSHSDDDTDLSSAEEGQSASEGDEDSDIDITMGNEDDSHELTQQRDYVRFPSYSRD